MSVYSVILDYSVIKYKRYVSDRECIRWRNECPDWIISMFVTKGQTVQSRQWWHLYTGWTL